jgi:hypothetical protein
LLRVVLEKIGEYFLLLPEAERQQASGNHVGYLGGKLNLIFASIFDDDVLVEVEDDLFVHGEVLDDLAGWIGT